MPDARSFTPGHASVEAAAQAALQSPEGLEVLFTVAALGSLSACAMAARSFQTSFASLRSRARRNSIRSQSFAGGTPEYARTLFATGIYDKLVCQRLPLPDEQGWRVALIPVSMAISMLDIRDIATGLPLETLGKHKSEKVTLQERFADVRQGWTREDGLRLLELDEEMAAFAKANGIDVLAPRADTTDRLMPSDLKPASIDLADLADGDGDIFDGMG